MRLTSCTLTLDEIKMAFRLYAAPPFYEIRCKMQPHIHTTTHR